MALTPEEFQHAVDVVASYGSIVQASAATGIARSTLQERHQKAILKGYRPRSEIVNQARDKKYDVPMSESEGKYHAEWTPQDCVNELRRIASIDPEQVITRNYFRNHSGISESTWNRYFGTFEEFKKQAGIVLSRHAKSLERGIAKHASVDEMRRLNQEKAGYEDAYLKPSNKRYRTAVGCSDVHDIECDPFYRAMFIESVLRIQPDRVILAGDIFDLYEFGSYTKDPREWDVMGRIQWVHKFLEDIREASPDSEITFIEGNHEHRLLRHLAEATPALKVVLSDLHGFTVSSLLGLDKFEVNYHGRMDLGTFRQADIKRELARNSLLIDECFLVSHYPTDRKHMIAGFAGHHHKHLVWNIDSLTHGNSEFHQLGGGHGPKCTYTDGGIWNRGFIVCHYDTERLRTQFEYVDVTHDHCVLGGRWYLRDAVLKGEK